MVESVLEGLAGSQIVRFLTGPYDFNAAGLRTTFDSVDHQFS